MHSNHNNSLDNPKTDKDHSPRKYRKAELIIFFHIPFVNWFIFGEKWIKIPHELPDLQHLHNFLN